jgi:hypothetical protein
MAQQRTPTADVFTPALQIDPVDGRMLIEALSGRWSYEKEARRDKRNVWFHVANAFSLLIGRLAPGPSDVPLPKIEVKSQFSALDRSTWAGRR